MQELSVQLDSISIGVIGKLIERTADDYCGRRIIFQETQLERVEIKPMRAMPNA